MTYVVARNEGRRDTADLSRKGGLMEVRDESVSVL